MLKISLKRLSNFLKFSNTFWTFTKMAPDPNPVSGAAFQLNLGEIKAWRSYWHISLFLCLFVRTRVKSELCSVYHKEWYLKFCQKAMFFFSFLFFPPMLGSIASLFSVFTKCIMWHPPVFTLISSWQLSRYSWVWLAAQEGKVTVRSWEWIFEISCMRKCRHKSLEIILALVVSFIPV